MARDVGTSSDSVEFHRPHVNSALRVSVQSIAWTVVASIASVVLGIRTGTAVLLAFGAIGLVDAVGSIALAYHFHHGLRHDELSEPLERLAHRVVLVGLLAVGCAAVVGGVVRLAAAQAGEGSDAGVVLAGASLLALTALSVRKQRIARRVSSNALRSDGHLSAIGATQAAVALAGTATARWLDWHWADAAATVLVGCVAVALAISTWRTEHGKSLHVRAVIAAPIVAVLLIATADALLGSRLILIGLLIVGPVVATRPLRIRPVVVVSAISIVMAIALGSPDGIWRTKEHFIWVGAVVVVSLADVALVSVVTRPLRGVSDYIDC